MKYAYRDRPIFSKLRYAHHRALVQQTKQNIEAVNQLKYDEDRVLGCTRKLYKVSWFPYWT